MSDDIPARPARRTLVRSAVWSAPVVAVAATAAPGAAASQAPLCEDDGLVQATGPSAFGRLDSGTAPATQWVVPQGVTSVTFDVAGGGGGTATASSPGNERMGGARLQGTLAVLPGDVLAMTVGQGGYAAPTSGVNDSLQPSNGGAGFGNGGSVQYGAGWDPDDGDVAFGAGGSGGGGSAILVNGVPAVVAAGGGGARRNQSRWPDGPNFAPDGWTQPQGWNRSALGQRIEASKGGGWNVLTPVAFPAVPTPGAGGAPGTVPAGYQQPNDGLQSSPGNSGGAFVPGSGGSGGNGVFEVIAGSGIFAGESVGIVSGAGGGGYAGGGSGSTIAAGFDTDEDEGIVSVAGASGGRGTSYVGQGVSSLTTTNAANAAGAARGPGWARITFTCP